MTEFDDGNPRESKRMINSMERHMDMDIDLVQQYIKQDLNQNEYFKYEHDLDFCIPDFIDEINERISEEPHSAERWQTSYRQTLRASSKMNLQAHENLKNYNDVVNIIQHEDIQNKNEASLDSLDREFEFEEELEEESNDHLITTQKQKISVFTFNQKYLDSKNNIKLLFKNVEILKQNQTPQQLADFYKYLTSLELSSTNTINQRRFDMLYDFINILSDILNIFEELFHRQQKWLKTHPTLPIINIYSAFSFQWERFQDQAYNLIEQSSIKKPRNHLQKIKNFEEELHIITQNKGSEIYLHNNLMEQQQDQEQEYNIIQSNLESIIQFQVRVLTRLHQHFLHIRFLSRKGQNIFLAKQSLKSRYLLFNLLRDKIKITNKANMKMSQTKLYTKSLAEQIFSLDQTYKLDIEQELFPAIQYNKQCIIRKRYELQFNSKSKQLAYQFQQFFSQNELCVFDKNN